MPGSPGASVLRTWPRRPRSARIGRKILSYGGVDGAHPAQSHSRGEVSRRVQGHDHALASQAGAHFRKDCFGVRRPELNLPPICQTLLTAVSTKVLPLPYGARFPCRMSVAGCESGTGNDSVSASSTSTFGISISIAPLTKKSPGRLTADS